MELNNHHQASSAHWSVRQAGILRGFSGDRWVLVAQLLMLLNLVAMTRAFALVSLVEFLLWCLFLFYSPLRAAFLESFSDIRIKLVFAFWGWIAIATLWSPADFGLRFEEVWSWRKLLLFPMAWVLFGNPCLKRAAVFTLIVTASIYMFFSWAGYLGYVSLDRAPSQLLENHATQGVVFASASLMLVMMLNIEVLPTWMKLVFCLLIVGMVTNIIFVLTGRTSYVSLMVIALYCSWVVISRQRLLAMTAVFCSISLALYISETASSRVEQALDEFELTISGDAQDFTSMGIRWVYWENTLKMIATNPFLGSGSGGFYENYKKVVVDQHGWRSGMTDDPHQQYLLIAGEQGLIGLGLFLTLLLAMLMSRGDDKHRVVAIGILLMTSFNGLFNGHFGSFVEGRLFWIMMGVMLCSTHPHNSFERLQYVALEISKINRLAIWLKEHGK